MIIEIIFWLLVVETFSFAAVPICIKVFSCFSDRGYAASKLVGISITSYMSWLFGFVLGFSREVIFISLIIITSFSAYLFFKNKKEIINFLKSSRKNILQLEAIFILLFIFFLLIRAQKPEIDSLEKFMDFGFINSMVISDSIPPHDMWLSGESINYYYFGHLITASLTKFSGIPSNFAYNLAFAMWYAIFALLVYSFVTELTKKKLYGLLAILLVCILGNLFGIFQIITFTFPQTAQPLSQWLGLDYPINCCWQPESGLWENVWNFQLWPSTRIVSNAINEFPMSSFLFGDLHAHYIGFSFQIMFFMLLLCLVRKNFGIPVLFASGFFLGIAGSVNFWIYFIAIPSLAMGIFQPKRDDILRIFSIIALGFILFSPFYLNMSKAGSSFGFMEERLPITHLILIFGLPASTLWFVSMKNWRDGKVIKIIAASAVIAIISGIHSLFFSIPLIYWSSGFRKEEDEKTKLSMLLAAAATIALISTEIVYFDSRFNYIFKLYHVIWITYGIASALILNSLIHDRFFRPLLVAVLLMGAIVPFFVIMNFYHISNIKGIDGTAYMENYYPDDFGAILWIKENLREGDIILESPGRAYTYDSRISSNTGIPTVIGWVNHEFSWRGLWFSEREEDVNQFYRTVDKNLAMEILSKYNVTYVYLGGVEKGKYPAEGLNKFGSMTKLSLVYDNGSKIYWVVN